MAIFINKVLYSTIMCQKDNIDIQVVLTFFKILAPFIFINFANFINSKTSLGFWKNNCTRFETTFQLCSPSTSMTKFEQGWFYEPYNEPLWNVNPNSKNNC